MSMTPGSFNFPPARRGDTYDGFSIKLKYSNDEYISIKSARIQLRSNSQISDLVFEYSSQIGNLSIDQNTIILSAISGEITKEWPIDTLNYDLEVTLISGEIWTILEGTLAIKRDITR